MRIILRAAPRVFILVALFLLVSCLPVPLGDPEKSKVEEKYLGAWTWQTPGTRHLAVIRPWDARTYVIRLITLNEHPGEKKAEEAVLKGWLTTVEGETMMTLQEIESLSTLPGEKTEKQYVILKLNRAGDMVIATSLNPSFPPFEALISSEELERLIRQHMENPAMWAEQPINARQAEKAECDAFYDAVKNAMATNRE